MNPTALAPTIGLILHFRHHAHTAACLASLQADGIDRGVLVDNSEDDGASLSLLRPALAMLAAQGMDIALCEPGRNLGFSAGVNRGLAEIRKRFGEVCVLLINNDARLRPGGHSALRGAIEQGNELAVAPQQSSAGETIASAFYHRATGLLLRRSMPGAYEYLSGCCMLLAPRLATPPLFDEAFFFYGDDTELGWRLKQRGIPQAKVPTALVEHETSTGSRNGSMFYEYHMVRAHWLLAGKLAGNRAQHGLYLAGRTLFLPMRVLLRAVRQRTMVPVRALFAASRDVALGRRRSMTPPPR